MRQTTRTRKSLGEKIVKDIKRATRKQYSSEEKIRIILDGLRSEDRIAELYRREGISQGIHYKWSKDFLEVGKRRLADNINEADSLLRAHQRALLTHFSSFKINQLRNLEIPENSRDAQWHYEIVIVEVQGVNSPA